MTESDRERLEQRVLVLAPTAKDAELTRSILSRIGVECVCCPDLDEVFRQLEEGAGAALLAEECVMSGAWWRLAEWLHRQPPWSDLPLLILAGHGADSPSLAEAMDRLGNVTVVERPTRVATLVSSVRTALRARQRQYQIRRHIEQRVNEAETLRAAQEQLRIVTDHMAVAVTRVSRDLRYLWVSQGCAAWLGLEQEDILGRTIGEVIGTAAYERVRPHIERALAGESVEFEMQVPYRTLGMRWIKAMYVPTRDRAGSVDGWVAVITDTTAHHEMEDALRDADRRKTEFLAILAHELRNPLAPIRNSLHLLRVQRPDDPDAERVGQMMERQVTHMVRLVDDLLEVSRITRGKIELRKERLELASVVRTAVETSRPLLEAGGHPLEIALPGEPLVVDGDPVRLAQVVANLLNNAAKYTDEGGRVWLTVKRESGRAVLSVRDEGIGIPSDQLPIVFDLFRQLDVHSERSQGGLGIGLTLVKSLVELHGGEVEAFSEGPGRGSEFVVRLPLLPTRAGSDLSDTRSRPLTNLTRRRVLVVDDNRDAAESLGMVLKMLGAEVSVVFSGQEALQALPIYKPAVVLLDIGMPKMNGHEVARRIREKPEYRDVILIALTGWGQDEDRRRSETAGFDHHLIKPADVGTLEALFQSLEKGLAKEPSQAANVPSAS